MSSFDSRVVFLGLDLQYSESVLTPRLETEKLVIGALQRVEDFEVCIDVGTGSGAIALSVGQIVNKRSAICQIYGVDISEQALSVARRNAFDL